MILKIRRPIRERIRKLINDKIKRGRRIVIGGLAVNWFLTVGTICGALLIATWLILAAIAANK